MRAARREIIDSCLIDVRNVRSSVKANLCRQSVSDLALGDEDWSEEVADHVHALSTVCSPPAACS